jgi:hypothetical protein
MGAHDRFIENRGGAWRGCGRFPMRGILRDIISTAAERQIPSEEIP